MTLGKIVPTPLAIAPGESLFGFMSRIAAANLYERSTWLLDELWASNGYDTSIWSAAMIDQVAAISGLERAEIASRTYAATDEDRQSFFGHPLPGSLIVQTAQKSRMRFCPECLASGIHHAIFDLAVVTVCPLHSRRTTEHCPHCDKPTYWGSGDMARCRGCKGDLTAAETERVARDTLCGLQAIIDLVGLPCP